MRCPDCNFDNPEGMKFCGNCGKPLCNVCPDCGSKNPVEFKFCGNCGTPFAPPQTPDNLARIQKYIPSYLAEKIRQSEGRVEGERKSVSVIFADISGFTPMAETHDPEEVSDIATICHTMLGKIVCKYEGVVDKIIGDGLMAIFGIPTHEDDPERAILAAIEMQQDMKDLSRELWEGMGVSLGLSIGINTGTAVIGDIGTDLRLDYTAMGDVVNTASRVEEKAESGEILVTQETRRRTVHCFDFQSLDPIRVKGKSQPIHIYKVIRQKEKPLQARGTEGLNAPLIGRDREFAVCKHVVDDLAIGEGGTLLITGEAGHGKSRLAGELKEYTESRNITWLEGKCVSYSRSINYRVFVDALRDYFDIKNNDDAPEVERKIRQKSEELRARSKGQEEDPYASESTISAIGSFLSSKLKTEEITDDLAESEKKLRIFTAVKDVLAAESQLEPVILVLEDLHWADELSIELLLFLIKELSQNRVTFVCIYRPPIAGGPDICHVQRLEEEYSTATSTNYTRVALNPLSNTDSNMFLESLLDAERLPLEMKRLILGKAGGNPLYLEEVIKSIIDDGTIEYRDGRWLAVKEIEDIEVPSTIQGVIMARIDRLEEEPKHILQCASVIGRSFEHDLLSYLITGSMISTTPQLPGSSERIEGAEFHVQDYSSALDQHLGELEKMGFISREEGPERTFRFRHALIQDVAYSNTLIRRRKELHEIVGRYIEEFQSRHLDEFYEILAHHYSNSDNTEASLSYLVKAGDKNRRSSAGSAESALGYFHKALDVLDNSSLKHDKYAPHKHDIYDGIGETYKDLGKYEVALSSFEAAFRVAEQAKDDLMKAEALRKIASSKDQMGDWEDALKIYEESLAITQSIGDHTRTGLVYNCIGGGCFARGDLDEAVKYFQEALRIGDQIGDLRLIGDASSGLGVVASIRHDFDEAIRNHQASLHSYKAAGDSHYEAQTYMNLGITHFKKNELGIADKYYEESLKVSEKCGYSKLTICNYLNRAELSIAGSALDRARDFCNKAFQILRTLDDDWARAEGYKIYGMIYRRQRDFHKAKESLRSSLKLSRKCDYLPNMAEAYYEMGLVYKEEGMSQKALEHFNRSKGIFEELDIVEEVEKVDEYITEIRSAHEEDTQKTEYIEEYELEPARL